MQLSSQRKSSASSRVLLRAPFRLHFSAVAIAALSCVEVAAQAEAIQLEEVVVTATRFAEPARSLPFGVSVITAEEIREAGATTVNEAIMRVLGVPGRADFYGGGDYSLDLRGFGEAATRNQVIVLDGIRLNEADLSVTRLAGLPIDTVERIEVLRGSGAVLYGEGATGGVIVITTKAGTGKARRNTASLYAGAGSYGLRELRADATAASSGFSLDVSGAKRKADNHRNNFRSDFDAASVTAQWRNEWLRIGARHGEDDLDTGLPGSLSAAQYAANPRQTNSPLNRASIDNTRSSLFAEATLGNWQVGLDVGRREKKLESISYSATGVPSTFAYKVDAEHQSLKARHQTSFAGVQNVLMLGTEHSKWHREVLGTFGSLADQSSHAWYLKDDVTLPGSGTRLSAGGRTERISKNQASSSASSGVADRLHAWELGLNQPIAGTWSIYGRVGRSFRLANADEFSFTTSNTSLRPQTSQDMEIGSRWSQGATRLEARLYRSNLENELGYDPNTPNPRPWNPAATGANVNFDPTRRQGLEVDASYTVSRTIDLAAHAALRDSTFRSGPYAGNDVPLAPQRTLALRVGWQPAANHRLSGGMNWVSDQHPGGDFANACRMPSYTTADARYAYQWKQAELALGVSNLFDRQYYTQAFRCSNGVTNGIYPEAGRALTASARISF